MRLILTLFLTGALFFILQGSFAIFAQAQEEVLLTDVADQPVEYESPAANLSLLLEEESRIDSDFGGVWKSGDDRIKVGIVEGSETARGSKELVFDIATRLKIEENTDIIRVEYSWKELHEVNESIHQLHQKHVDYKSGAWPIQMGIKTDLNKVQVDVPADKEKLTDGHRVVLDEIEARYKDQVIFHEYEQPVENEAACNWWFCNSPLRGGVGIQRTTGEIDCTAGFIVKGVSSGRSFVLTAGHCQPYASNPSVYTWRTKTYNYTLRTIGSVVNVGHNLLYNSSNPVDAMIVLVNDENYWKPMSAILKRSGNPGSLPGGSSIVPVITYKEDHAIPGYNVVGDKVCISPAITGDYTTPPNGGSCGSVHQVAVQVTAGGITTQVNRAGYCSRPGDSGSPMYDRQVNRARGIHRAAGVGMGVCNEYKYYTPMNTIMNRFNATGHSIKF